ncbi:MAG: hypothetical protein NTW96_16745, partial [Planctomycetia bacterium]|nr:hypothetical protein [Planctomycetia bacterium]
MKRFLLRMSALAMVLVLGWIAIAHAQRQNDEPEPAGAPAPSSSDRIPPQPLIVGQSSRANPLRTENRRPTPIETRPATVRQTAHETAAAASAPPSSPPDLFGLQSAGTAAASETVGEADASTPAEPGTLVPGGPERPLTPPTAPELAAPAAPSDASTPRSLPPRETPLRAEPASPLAPANASSTQLPSFSPGSTTPSQGARALPTRPVEATDPVSAAPSDAAAFDSSSVNVGTSAEGTGQPASDKQLDGPQSPQLSVQKFAP